jgi:hypothetical protein
MVASDVSGLLKDAGATGSGARDSREGGGGSRPEAASLREIGTELKAQGFHNRNGRHSRHAEKLIRSAS